MLWLFGFSSSLWGGFWQLPKSPYFAFQKNGFFRNSQNSLPSNTYDRLHLFFTAKDLYLNSNRWSLHLQIGASLCVILSRSINVTQLFQKVSCRLQYVVTVLYRSIDIIYIYIYVHFFLRKTSPCLFFGKKPNGKITNLPNHCSWVGVDPLNHQFLGFQQLRLSQQPEVRDS